METKISSPNLGAIAAVRGSVVDVRFEGPLPPIYSVLRTGGKRNGYRCHVGKKNNINSPSPKMPASPMINTYLSIIQTA